MLVRLLLWPTWTLLRPILTLIRTLPVAKQLMPTLPSIINKYSFRLNMTFTCFLIFHLLTVISSVFTAVFNENLLSHILGSA